MIFGGGVIAIGRWCGRCICVPETAPHPFWSSGLGSTNDTDKFARSSIEKCRKYEKLKSANEMKGYE
jgi:hypothetical protein